MMTLSSMLAQFSARFTPSGRRESQPERDARKHEKAAQLQRINQERLKAKAEGKKWQ
jgi:hypothetical protein